MQYKEVHNLEESLAILDKYKNELTKEQYRAIYSSTCNLAIENIYANESDILRTIALIKGKMTEKEAIDDLRKELRSK